MPPQEKSPLLGSKEQHDRYSVHAPHSLTSFVDLPNCTRSSTKNPFRLAFQKYFKSILATTLVAVFTVTLYFSIHVKSRGKATGAYRVVEIQQGSHFTDSYAFYNGADSIGSAGYNTYVSQQRALDLGLIRITDDQDVFIQSSPTIQGPRESIRLEGKRRYNRGLFVIDLNHMPAGCGVWPAVWLTDEANWPDHGEIDIVEGVNTLKTAKTAQHTSESCSMYAHVPDDSRTGHWDSATGIPDTFTGSLDNFTRVRADNCWVMAPHQWANQGCVAVHDKQGTIGTPFNQQGGGVYVLEWDPVAGYIKSWVFSPHEAMPENLQKAMNTASDDNPAVPEPTLWGVGRSFSKHETYF
jgi:hypothetical protein